MVVVFSEKDTQYKHFRGRLEPENLALDLLVEAVGAHDDATDGETLVDTGHFVFPIKVYRHLTIDKRARAPDAPIPELTGTTGSNGARDLSHTMTTMRTMTIRMRTAYGRAVDRGRK